MRRYRKSYLRSFANGVLLAGLPIAAFFGADYLLAPPASGTDTLLTTTSTTDSGNRDGSIVNRVASATTSQSGPTKLPPRQDKSRAAEGQTVDEAARPATTQPSTASNSGKNGLVAAIQNELVRVGCYAGEPDGAWSDRTRVAMQAFNMSVHVNLPTGSPDYILLTLLQGHSAKACTRSCEVDAARPGACVDKSMEARAIAPPAAAAPVAATASSVAPSGWTSTVVVAAPGKVTMEMLGATPPAALAPKTAAAGAPKLLTPEVQSATEPARPDAAVVQSDSSGIGSTSGTALEGRMAVGLLPPAPIREKSVTQAVVKPRADANRETPRPQRVQATAPARSPRSTFSDLSRMAP